MHRVVPGSGKWSFESLRDPVGDVGNDAGVAGRRSVFEPAEKLRDEVVDRESDDSEKDS